MTDQHTCSIVLGRTLTHAETTVVQEGLARYNTQQTNGAFNQPGIEINLVLKDAEGKVVGGIEASTVLSVMHLEALWVAHERRKLGYGTALVLEAERMGYAAGCIASQTYTFSFQAPEFYKKLGYRVLGIYDGYPEAITEHVLMKRLPHHTHTPADDQRLRGDGNAGRFSISEPATENEMKTVHAGLGRYVDEQIGDERNNPGIGIQLVMQDRQGQVVGGLLAGTTIQNMYIEHLWVDKPYRGLGYGTKLMLTADRIAQEHGCIACQTYCLSFQAPEFFQKLGYETYGISDGYPKPVQEYYLIKRYKQPPPRAL